MGVDQSPELPSERRRFLTRVIAGAATVIAALTVLPGVGMLLAPILARNKSRRAKVVFQNPADASSTTFVLARYEGELEMAPGIYVRREANGQPLVLSAKCTHAGCPVQWRADENQFYCPCHQGRFDATGKNISGPATRPLDRLKAEVVSGDVYVEEPQA